MINFGISSILFSPNTPSQFVCIMRKPLGVQCRVEMGDYMVCPMDVDGRSSSKFATIIEKMNNKISSWKFSNLSASGKLILINNVLIPMASHVLSAYLCPSLVLKKLSSTLMNFWWASSKDAKPIYWRKKEVLFFGN